METITSRQNAQIRHVTKLLSSRAYRYAERQFAGDGVKLLEEAVLWHSGLNTVFLTGENLPFSIPDTVRTIRIPESLMTQISPMRTPQGALFVCDMPQEVPLRITPGCLILDGLQDPGNLGTILRTADAFDIPVILTPDSVDPYNPKVVRSAMGALFRSRFVTAAPEMIAEACRTAGVPILCADLTESALDIRESNPERAAVVIGNEGNGVSAYFRANASGSFLIPMQSHCESLNAAVAAAVSMWEMYTKRQPLG